MSNILYIVVPCYNEQEVLPETSKRLREKVQTLRQSGKIDADSRILFVLSLIHISEPTRPY